MEDEGKSVSAGWLRRVFSGDDGFPRFFVAQLCVEMPYGVSMSYPFLNWPRPPLDKNGQVVYTIP